MVPIQSSGIPLEIAGPTVSALCGAILYQTRQLYHATKRTEQLHDEDRRRQELESQRWAETERKILQLQEENAKLRAALARKRRRAGQNGQRSA